MSFETTRPAAMRRPRAAGRPAPWPDLVALAAATLLTWGCAAPPNGAARAAEPVGDRTGAVDTTVAFVGATVLPMDRDVVLEDQTVLVRNGRIEAVGPADAVQVPATAQRIDARGRFLLPGLVDMHVHFNHAEQVGDLWLYVANGVTTIRNMHAHPSAPILEWRDEVQRGRRAGPTIYTTGPILSELADSAHVERVIAEHRNAGYDFLKVYVQLPADRYRQLVRRAREEDIPFVGHVPVAIGLEEVVRSGQQTLEHAEDLFQSHFRMRSDASLIPPLTSLLDGSRTCVVPTLVVFRNVVAHFEEFPYLAGLTARSELRYVGPATRREWAPERNSYVRRNRAAAARMPDVAARVRSDYEFMKRIVAALDSAGVPLLAGSDANVPHTIPGFSLLQELEILVEQVGMTPAGALRAATRAPAECMGKADEFGAVAPGLRADLLLLEANPLDDVRHLRHRTGVMAQGQWWSEAELQERLDSLAAR